MQHKKKRRNGITSFVNRPYYTAAFQTLLVILLIVCTFVVPLYLKVKVIRSEAEIKNNIDRDHSSVEINLFHKVNNRRNDKNIRKKATVVDNKENPTKSIMKDNIADGKNSDEKQANQDKIQKEYHINDFEWYSHHPMLKTPSLQGAQAGKIKTCEENVNDLTYWNDPQGVEDIKFQSPFTTASINTKYVTFEFPTGGWNNIRMAIEIIFIFASVTNRTIVLPPKQEIYLLQDKTKRYLDFTDFFALDRFMDHNNSRKNKAISIITAEEFIKRECHSNNGRFPIPNEQWDLIESISKVCEDRKKSDIFCGKLFAHVMKFAANPYWKDDACIVFDENAFHGKQITQSNEDRANQFCKHRKKQYYTASFDNASIVHFSTSALEYRLLDHFYFIFLFTNPKIHYHYHRFIRDHLHYNDLIYCAAGKIIHALQKEGIENGFIRTHATTIIDKGSYNSNLQQNRNDTSTNAIGYYSSLHVRRGDLQFKWVKIPAEEWYNNTKDVFLPNEILYIATDEKNRSFFNPLGQHYTIRFLDDYTKIFNTANKIQPAYYGMIDTIVASYGRQFAGTSFSTFTNYINRIRGYRGFSMKSTWYGTLQDKTKMQNWDDDPRRKIEPWTREYPEAWVRIDGDEFVMKSNF